ncbi:MAG: methylated-DNA--[protein]-cysteine S-methyltransferase [Desulfobulbus sp.]|jgi:methylated-DNA-[protein]-cysteine S-methyltransferase
MHWTSHLATPLGVFTLTADERGLCGLDFPGPTPPATLHPATHPLLIEAESQLLAYLRGELRAFDLPLSLSGTPFQLQVWEQLRAIAYGTTASYGELATRLGDRGKARAVGGAAHANPVAIVVPCHRLLGADGRLTGFGGGLAMKAHLLQLEGWRIRGSGRNMRIVPEKSGTMKEKATRQQRIPGCGGTDHG